jgi:hypothetical protein
MAENTQRLVMLIEAQNKDVLRKLNQIERSSKQAFDNSRKPLRQFNGDMVKAAGTAKKLAAAFGVGFAAAGLASLPSIIRGVVGEASQLAKTADKIGLGVEELQRLRFGFELTGVAANQTDTAMQRFSRRVAQAANGSGELYEILRQNDVALRNQDGSMRSQTAILRDYANLIQNAGSEQERLLLAFKAFDTEGAALVNGLKAGASGLDELMGKADAAGGVIDEALIRKAEEIDDQFATLWRNFEVNAKSAILAASSEMSVFLRQLSAFEKSFDEAVSSVLPAGLQSNFAKSRLEKQLAPTFGTRNVNSGMFYRDDIGAPTSSPPEITVTPTRRTIIPDQKRDAASKAASREADAVLRVIEALRLEQEQLGKTSQEKRILTELSRAGTMATTEQKEEIRQLVTEIEKAERAEKAMADAAQFFQGQAMSAFGAITSQIKTGNAALDRFLQSLIEATAQAALFGSGPLAGLFGGGGGGGIGGLLGGLFGGFFANGGNLGAGKWGIAGENGPEIIKGPAQVVPMNRMGSGGGQTQTVVQVVPSPMFDVIVEEKAGQSAAAAAQFVANDVRTNFSSYARQNAVNRGTG